MRKRKTFFSYLVIFLLSSAIPFLFSDAYAAPGKVPPGITMQIEQGGQADILLVLDDADAQALADQMRKNLGVKNDNAAITAEKVRLYKQKKTKVISRLSAADYVPVKDYDYFPVMFLRVNNPALTQLANMSEVASVSEDLAVEPYLTESLPLIGATPTQAWAYSTGAGTYVAVLDTGVNYTLSAFGSCSTPGVPSSCKVAYENCFATGGCQTDKTHGTNVSGIVVGVAPDTKVIALDVFQTNGYAYYSDILSALNWIMSNQTTYNIVAANMSFGGGQYYSQCPTDGLASAINTMKNAGITTAIASGNSGYTNSIGAPACAPAAVSVGAVYDSNVGFRSWCLDSSCTSTCTDNATAADMVTCFSNSASFLTMLAPGAIITAAGISMAGTSQAAPHVAGSVAVLKSLDNTLTVDRLVSGMTTTGVPVTDSRNGLTKPRLNLYGAISATDPIIAVNPPSVSFMGSQGGPNPAAQVLSITNHGGGTLNWSISSNASWLTVSPPSGTAPGSGTLSVNTTGLVAGSYSAALTITAPGALNSPLTVPVSLQVANSGYSETFETGNLLKFPWVSYWDLTWANHGTAPWAVENTVAHTGSYAAQSPSAPVNSLSYLQVTLNVTSPGYVYFWVKTNTESPSWENNLKFWIDGTNQGPFAGWYGNNDWTFVQSNIQVTAGVHTFKWGYSKTLSTDGNDAVWLDDIFFPPFTLIQTPVANFSGLPLSGNGPLAVTFTDSSTNNPTSWSWTFGDGGTSTLQNPVYTYQNAGTYSVSLTAANAGGQNTMTRTGYVTVTCPTQPVKIARTTPLYFSSLQSGYNAAVNGEVVQIQAVTLTETDLLNSGAAVTLDGGYNSCYTTNSGTYSTIVGPMTVSSPVTFRHIVIQKP